MAKNTDVSWLTFDSQYEDWLDMQETVSASYDIKNTAVAFGLILKLVERNLKQLQEGYENSDLVKQYVPVSTVIGRRKIPASAARIINKAVSKIQSENNIKGTELYKALEILAEKYLSGE